MRGLDPRIDSVMRIARSHAGPLPLQDLSEVACLSPDRLTHLFAALRDQGVYLEGILLKPNMVIRRRPF